MSEIEEPTIRKKKEESSEDKGFYGDNPRGKHTFSWVQSLCGTYGKNGLKLLYPAFTHPTEERKNWLFLLYQENTPLPNLHLEQVKVYLLTTNQRHKFLCTFKYVPKIPTDSSPRMAIIQHRIEQNISVLVPRSILQSYPPDLLKHQRAGSLFPVPGQ